eukprot:2346639-Pyramimonas_sp.AAC.1
MAAKWMAPRKRGSPRTMARNNTTSQQRRHSTLKLFRTVGSDDKVRQYVLETYSAKRGLRDELPGAQRARNNKMAAIPASSPRRRRGGVETN